MEYVKEDLVGDVLILGFQSTSISEPASVLKELARKQKQSGLTKIVVDFSGVDQFNAGMLGAMLTFRTHGLVHGFSLKLTGLSAQLKKVFGMNSLDGLFESCVSLREAIECFSTELHQPSSLTA